MKTYGMVKAEIHALSTLALYRGKWPAFCPGTLQPLPITQQAGATDYLDIVKIKKISFGSSLKTTPVSMLKAIASLTTLTDIPRFLLDPTTSLFNSSTLFNTLFV